MNDRILTDRTQLGDLANEMGFTTAVEVGTHQGVFADGFMSRFNGNLACVDPWADLPPPPHRTFLPAFVPTTPNRDFDHDLAQLLLNTKYPGRVVFHRMTSLQYAETLPNESQEFIYIDGLHTSSAVRADLLALWPKLKSGGVMAGHDYLVTLNDPTIIGVTVAVNWFVMQHCVDLFITSEPTPSWYFQKP